MTTMETSQASESSEIEPTITVSQLQAELDGSGPPEDETVVAGIVEEVQTTLFDGRFAFEESHVKTSLDELLVSLVALRNSDTHGKQLLDDLASEFDTVLSPGTVYPRLHDLCDDGVLEQRELVKTKEYALADAETARADVASAARQHLALGMVLHSALETGELD